MSKALIVVDVQNDFCEGGALAVEGGNAVAEKILAYIESDPGYTVVLYTKDHHQPWPATNGGHFSETPDFVNTWPPHCQQGTEGAEFHPAIEQAHARHAKFNLIFRKGDGRPDYSGFQGFNDQEVLLDEFMQGSNDIYGVIDEVDIVGIAGDYCVRETAIDAIKFGYKVNVLSDMVASVGGPEATDKTLTEIAGM